MPGVADGDVRHLSWGLELADLVEAGRYELLEAAAIADAGPGQERGTAAAGNATTASVVSPPSGGPDSARTPSVAAGTAAVKPRAGRGR